jgi:hypothetical protein
VLDVLDPVRFLVRRCDRHADADEERRTDQE